MAKVPSRITTNSNVVQPTNCRMLSSTGKRAKELPYTWCINPALDKPVSQAILATQPSRPAPNTEPSTMASKASWVPTAGTR
jgi:hypothetical protein